MYPTRVQDIGKTFSICDKRVEYCDGNMVCDKFNNKANKAASDLPNI